VSVTALSAIDFVPRHGSSDSSCLGKGRVREVRIPFHLIRSIRLRSLRHSVERLSSIRAYIHTTYAQDLLGRDMVKVTVSRQGLG